MKTDSKNRHFNSENGNKTENLLNSQQYPTRITRNNKYYFYY